jgi:hypothetical protein
VCFINHRIYGLSAICARRWKQMWWIELYTRWFKYDRDDLCVNKSQFVPVIFEPPCIYLFHKIYLIFKTVRHTYRVYFRPSFCDTGSYCFVQEFKKKKKDHLSGASTWVLLRGFPSALINTDINFSTDILNHISLRSYSTKFFIWKHQFLNFLL